MWRAEKPRAILSKALAMAVGEGPLRQNYILKAVGEGFGHGRGIDLDDLYTYD